MTMKQGDLLTVREVAQKLEVDESTVHYWIRTGKLEVVTLPYSGKRQSYRIRRQTFEELRNHRRGGNRFSGPTHLQTNPLQNERQLLTTRKDQDLCTNDFPVPRVSEPPSPEAHFLKGFFGLFASGQLCEVFIHLRKMDGTICVTEIAREMDLPPSRVSLLLQRLRKRGLVEATAHGAYRFYHIKWEGLREAFVRMMQLDSDRWQEVEE